MSEQVKQWITAGETVVSNMLLQHYHQLGLSAEELVFVLQLKSQLDRGVEEPELRIIGQAMGMPNDKLFHMIQALKQKNVLAIEEQSVDDKMVMVYSLEPLFNLLIAKVMTAATSSQKSQAKDDIKQLILSFETEFNRSLTPMELQTIDEWLNKDRYDVQLIRVALKEAVLSQAFSFRYIDAMLLSWERKNIRTAQQAEQESRQYRDKKDDSQQKKDLPTIPFIKFGK